MNAAAEVHGGTRTRGSLRRRLILWLLGPVLLVSTVLFFDAYRTAREVADRAYDRVIAASVLAIADRVISVDGQLDIDLPYVALEMLATEADDRVYYRIAEPDGALLTGYPDLPLPPGGQLPSADGPVFYDAIYRGETIRVGALTQRVTGPGAQGRLAVQVAQTRGQRDLLVRELASATAARLLALVVLIALATWLGVRFGLRPLVQLRSAVRERSSSDLRPLDVEVPREVLDMVLAINGHMTRLGQALNAMEQFISDAAHQLRTPLAALHTQVELALRESDPEVFRETVGRLRASTWRTSRLADQLLNLARSTADPDGTELARVDLAQLAEEVTRELVPQALDKDIDIGFENRGGPVPVAADAVLIQELVRNLVDNAIRYCPASATITVRVWANAASGQACLEVVDDGPGIAPTERQRVLERFHRGSGVVEPGSGLGLAIVRKVTERHGGQVLLNDGPDGGLRVDVRLPLLRDTG